MSQIPKFILSMLGLSREPETVHIEDMSCRMRQLVMDQQRTMFYTVTMSPTVSRSEVAKKSIKTPSLKVL